MAYQYESLISRNNEIRLLKLLSSSDPNSRVICELEIVPLGSCPSYSALSYCWGDIPKSETISLHGFNYEVTGNLYAALLALRKTDEVTLWWIDALCINQQDLEERSLQVLKMTAIYRTARRVIAWIGPETPGQPSLNHILEQSRVLLYSKPGLAGIGCFYHILSRQYWRRMWMVQEISVAIDLWVVCGSGWVEWDTFCGYFDGYGTPQLRPNTISTAENDDTTKTAFGGVGVGDLDRLTDNIELQGITTSTDDDLLQAYEALKTFRAFRQLVASQKPLGLIDGLKKTTSFLATDDRDRLYALLGLVHDGRSFVPTPDYNITFDELRASMAKNYLQLTKNLDVILAVSHERVFDGHIPSWTPNWLNQSFEACYAFQDEPALKFQACGTHAHKPIRSAQAEDPTCILVECLIFEEVDGLSSTYGWCHLPSPEPEGDQCLQPTASTSNPYEIQRRSITFKYSERTDLSRRNLINAIFNSLDQGSELSPESSLNRLDWIGMPTTTPEMIMYLYYGVNPPGTPWYNLLFDLPFAKRRYDSPALSIWLKENREWLIHGQTFENLCKSPHRVISPGFWKGALWGHWSCSTIAVLSFIGLIMSKTHGLDFLDRAFPSRDGPASSVAMVACACLFAMFSANLGVIVLLTLHTHNKMQSVQATFLKKMDKGMTSRSLRLAITGGSSADDSNWGGVIALVPRAARRGDKFAILKGCSTPVLLREYKDGYRLLGIVYMDGAMTGEYIEELPGEWKGCKLY